MKQAELLLGVLARHVDLNVGAEDAVVLDGFGPADEFTERVWELANVCFSPAPNFDAVEKHMEMNVFHVALKFAFGEQEWPDLNAIPHRPMVTAEVPQ